MDRTPTIVSPTRGRIEIPTEAGILTYVPSAVNGNYRNVGRQILGAEDVVPTGDYTAPLVHVAYVSIKKDRLELVQVRNIMVYRWLWVFNGNLFVAQDKSRGPKGVYVVPDREALGLNLHMDASELEKKLKGVKEINGVRVSSDRNVRFAEDGSYFFGEMDADKLAEDGFMRASFLPEGAKLSAEVAATLKNRPIIHGVDVNEGQKLVQRVSALDGNDSRLSFIGGWNVNDLGCGYAFPVNRAA